MELKELREQMEALREANEEKAGNTSHSSSPQ
jgi:hypothetical protein